MLMFTDGMAVVVWSFERLAGVGVAAGDGPLEVVVVCVMLRLDEVRLAGAVSGGEVGGMVASVATERAARLRVCMMDTGAEANKASTVLDKAHAQVL